MIEDRNMSNLAETLAKCGLAMSQTEAVRMAKSIIGTETKVAKDFEKVSENFGSRLDRKKMSYQEEIDYLIEKTSPENKNYHVPVKGYRREPVSAEQRKEEVREIRGVGEQVLVMEEKKEPCVYTDVLDGEKVLNVMVEEHTEKAETPKIEIKELDAAKPDDFIIPLQNETAPIQALEPEKAKEFKHPVDKVDLGNYFSRR